VAEPQVSIIIPTYNRAHFLPDAIESVFAQTYRNWELIVVDDGSTDNTKEVVEKYGSRVRYFYQENKGPGAARNLGIRQARGEYIAFLDSDDMWMPEKLERQVRLFEREPDVGLAGCGCYYVDEGGTVRGAEQAPYTIDHKDMQVRCALVGSTDAAMARRVCFEEVGLFDESLLRCEDWDMWLRISKRYTVKCIRDPLVKIRVHPGYRPNASDDIKWKARKAVINKNVQSPVLRRKGHSCSHLVSARAALATDQRLTAIGHLARSYATYPFRVYKGSRRGHLLLECLLPKTGYQALGSVWLKLKGLRSRLA
jgi:glycosyltransferase involved in cell wall biosynthesis